MKSKYIIAVILVILGIALLLDQYHVWTLGKIISTWWPLILVGLGFSTLLDHPKKPIAGIFMLLLGTIFQLNKLDLLPGSAWGYLWPLLLIILGLSILLSKNNHNKKQILSGDKSTSNDETLNINTIFSGIEHRVDSRNFAGGEVNCLFAGVEIDLRQTKLKNDTTFLKLYVALGEIVLRVPNDIILEINGSPFLAGFENNAKQTIDSSSKILKIKYSAIMGSIEITN